jgi:hypothetical protein
MARTETKIYLGAASIRLDELHRTIAQAERSEGAPTSGARRVGEASDVSKLREEFDTLRAEADEAGDYIVVRPLRDDEWDDLCDEHPPREEKRHADTDEALGFNARTGRRALIHAALVEPILATRKEFDSWVERKELTRGELEGVALQVWQLTNRTPFAPK